MWHCHEYLRQQIPQFGAIILKGYQAVCKSTEFRLFKATWVPEIIFQRGLYKYCPCGDDAQWLQQWRPSQSLSGQCSLAKCPHFIGLYWSFMGGRAIFLDVSIDKNIFLSVSLWYIVPVKCGTGPWIVPSTGIHPYLKAVPCDAHINSWAAACQT